MVFRFIHNFHDLLHKNKNKKACLIH